MELATSRLFSRQWSKLRDPFFRPDGLRRPYRGPDGGTPVTRALNLRVRFNHNVPPAKSVSLNVFCMCAAAARRARLAPMSGIIVWQRSV